MSANTVAKNDGKNFVTTIIKANYVDRAGDSLVALFML